MPHAGGSGGRGFGTFSDPNQSSANQMVNQMYDLFVPEMNRLQKEQIAAQAAAAQLQREFEQSSANQAMQFEADQARLQREFEQSSADQAMQFEAEQAQLQRDWQSSANQIAMDFEMNEAQKQRNFQENQRRTQYQVAMADMKAAGLNPILAYNQGGAGTTSGAMASGFSSSGSSASGFKASGSFASGFKASGSKAEVDTRTSVEVMQTLVSSATQLIGSLANSAASLVGSDRSALSRMASSRYGSKFFK